MIMLLLLILPFLSPLHRPRKLAVLLGLWTLLISVSGMENTVDDATIAARLHAESQDEAFARQLQVSKTHLIMAPCNFTLDHITFGLIA